MCLLSFIDASIMFSLYDELWFTCSLEVRENVIVTLCKWPPLAAQDVQLETENIAFRM